MALHPRFHDVWLVPTAHGPAIRNTSELVAEETGSDGIAVMRRIGVPVSHASIIPVLIPTASLLTAPFLPSDLPDLSRADTEVCNV